jgi:hypothetical protein
MWIAVDIIGKLLQADVVLDPQIFKTILKCFLKEISDRQQSRRYEEGPCKGPRYAGGR